MGLQYFFGVIIRLLSNCISKLDKDKRTKVFPDGEDASDVSKSVGLYLNDPDNDFTRRRKLSFIYSVLHTLKTGMVSLGVSLIEDFNGSEDTPAKSALCSRKKLIKPRAFQDLFEDFTKRLHDIFGSPKFKGFNIVAIDGSDLHTFTNGQDETTKKKNGGKKAYNQIHSVFLVNVFTGLILDIIPNIDNKLDERSAAIQLIDGVITKFKQAFLFVMDRGFESWNLFLHIELSGHKFVCRCKDIMSNGILAHLNFGNLQNCEFDLDFITTVTKKGYTLITTANDAIKGTFTKLSSSTRFDYFDDKTEFVTVMFRIIRFRLPNGEYETLVTNLPREQYPAWVIVAIYTMRWSIETNIKKVKHTLALNTFHYKLHDLMLQELYAKCMDHNAVSMITSLCNNELNGYEIKVNLEELIKNDEISKLQYELDLAASKRKDEEENIFDVEAMSDEVLQKNKQELNQSDIMDYLHDIQVDGEYLEEKELDAINVETHQFIGATDTLFHEQIKVFSSSDVVPCEKLFEEETVDLAIKSDEKLSENSEKDPEASDTEDIIEMHTEVEEINTDEASAGISGDLNSESEYTPSSGINVQDSDTADLSQEHENIDDELEETKDAVLQEDLHIDEQTDDTFTIGKTTSSINSYKSIQTANCVLHLPVSDIDEQVHWLFLKKAQSLQFSPVHDQTTRFVHVVTEDELAIKVYNEIGKLKSTTIPTPEQSLGIEVKDQSPFLDLISKPNNTAINENKVKIEKVNYTIAAKLFSGELDKMARAHVPVKHSRRGSASKLLLRFKQQYKLGRSFDRYIRAQRANCLQCVSSL